jgi:toxin ParE1/3/4
VKPVEIAAAAQDEAQEAARWYEARRSDLGASFLDELQATLDRLQPCEQHAVFDEYDGHPLRRAHMKRFPYRLLFIELPDRVHVVAVAHARRRPGFWHER